MAMSSVLMRMLVRMIPVRMIPVRMIMVMIVLVTMMLMMIVLMLIVRMAMPMLMFVRMRMSRPAQAFVQHPAADRDDRQSRDCAQNASDVFRYHVLKQEQGRHAQQEHAHRVRERDHRAQERRMLERAARSHQVGRDNHFAMARRERMSGSPYQSGADRLRD